MFNIFDRDFTTLANETERELKIPALTGQDGKLMRGLTQENVEMNRQVKIEKNRAMKKEYELEALIHNLHDYVLQPLEFGGTWNPGEWPDSVTVLLEGENFAVLGLPPMPYTYPDEPEINFPFFRNEVPYYLHIIFDEDGVMRIDGLYKPQWDRNTYTIAVSVKPIPWLGEVEKDRAAFAIAYLKEDAQESVQVQTQRFEINGRLGTITAGQEQTQTVKLHKTLFIPDLTAMSYSDDTFIWTVNEESDKLIVSASGHTLAAGDDTVEFTLVQGTSVDFTLSELYTVKYYG